MRIDTKSIIFQINLVLAAIVTVVLVLSGFYNYRVAKQELEFALNDEVTATLARLTQSLPASLWNIDTPKVEVTVQSEMGGTHVLAIVVYDQKTAVVGFRRTIAGAIDNKFSELASDAEKREGELLFDDSGVKKNVGKVVLYVNHDKVRLSLNSLLLRLVLQMLVVEMVLLVALSLRGGPVQLDRKSVFLSDISAGF